MTTMSKKITLKAPTIVYGFPNRYQDWPSSMELPAGTTVSYSREMHGADYLPFIEVVHSISFVSPLKGREVAWATFRTDYKLRHAFDPSTYYTNAIERLPEGLWNSKTARAIYMADDGFGELVRVPDQSVRPNHHSTCKAVDDCVVGWHYFIPKYH